MTEGKYFWKRYWDLRSQLGSSNYEVDRGVPFQGSDIESRSEGKLRDFVKPEPGDVVFDAGCGTGINLRRFGPCVKEIIGMDYSEGMVSRAQKRILEDSISNAKLMVGSISGIGLKSGIFDKIICISVLQYLNDDECDAALREFVRISRDGATIVLHVKNLTSLYLSTLYLAKKLKKLIRKDVIIEYYRPRRWYENRLAQLNVNIEEYYSVNIFLLDFLPPFMFRHLKSMEMKYYRSRYLRKYGADLNLRAIVRKGENSYDK